MQKLEEARARAKEGYEDERDAEDDLAAADEYADDDADNEVGGADGADVDPQRAKKFTLVGISDVVKFRERKVSNITFITSISILHPTTRNKRLEKVSLKKGMRTMVLKKMMM